MERQRGWLAINANAHFGMGECVCYCQGKKREAAEQSTSMAINGLAAAPRHTISFFLPNDAINSAQKDGPLTIKANWM